MMTHVYPALPCGPDTFDYRGWFIQPYRGTTWYGYWRGESRTSGEDRHDTIVTQPTH